MLENTHIKICRRLMKRDFKHHKMKTFILAVSISLVCAMCTFTFCMGYILKSAYKHINILSYGSTSHILYYGMTSSQAELLAGHNDVRNVVCLSPIGILKHDVLAYRTVNLSPVNTGWAKTIEAVPTQGRMPLSDDEIALDQTTLDALSIPRKLGTSVTLQWQSSKDNTVRTNTFRLSGWWSSVADFRETCAWITSNAARALSPDTPDSITAGVTLHQPDNLDVQALRLLEDTGLPALSFTTNLAYNKERTQKNDKDVLPYFLINILVAICGILMIYNIVSISIKQNMKFYKLLKSLGMTPRLIRRLSMEQAAFLCLPSIPIGWIIGFCTAMLIAPLAIAGEEKNNLVLYYFEFTPYAAAAVLTYLSVLISCLLPVGFVSMLSPAQMNEYFIPGKRKKYKPGAKKTGFVQSRRPTTIFSMAEHSFLRDKDDIILSCTVLFFSLALLCCAWTQFISYNENIYLSETSPSDYLLADSTAMNGLLQYNPENRSITPDIIKALQDHPAVTKMGVIKTLELPMTADMDQRRPIINVFEGKDSNGAIRKETMAFNPDWLDGYERFKSSGEYVGIITGMDGLALDVAMNADPPNEGVFDAEKFAEGNYVVAVGASSQGLLTTPPVGSKVWIGGREFTIMVSQPAHANLITGGNSRAAEFNISYYMPTDVFAKLFPQCGNRNVIFNIKHSMQKEFEHYLTDLLKDTNVYVLMRSYYQSYFNSARLNEVLLELLIGIILLLIGILNFSNSLITKMLVRKKELAVYESLGMIRQEMRRMVLYEGLLYSVSLTVFLIPAVCAATVLWSQWWVHNTSTWCVTFRLSFLPLWVSLPVLALFVTVLPLICLRELTKENVTQRLSM